MSANENNLKVNEIFYSIQGESTHTGRPCIFIRLTYCNLRCTWCDTEYAFHEGKDVSFEDILTKIAGYKCKLVEITGGEPLVQKNVIPFMNLLCDEGYEVLLETGGHMDITPVDKRVKRIMDIKCPGSGESGRMKWENLELLTGSDEIKFVILDREDFDWAVQKINEYRLDGKVPLIFSPVWEECPPSDLADWLKKSGMDARLQIQLHKLIWSREKRGV